MRGKEGWTTGWSNVISSFLCHPSILFKLPTMLKTKHATEKKMYGVCVWGGGWKYRKREGQFFQPFNNGGMISAYPLITTLLFSSPPSCLLSLAPRNPSFSSSGERKGSLFLSPASLFCHLSICLSFQPSPLQRRDSAVWCWSLSSFPSLLHPNSSSFFSFNQPLSSFVAKYQNLTLKRRLVCFFKISFKTEIESLPRWIVNKTHEISVS